MKKYIITIQEQYSQLVEVEAETKEEAIRKVVKGEGLYLENTLEFVDTLDTDTWKVEESTL